MTVDGVAQVPESHIVGKTTITARALQRVAVGIVRDAARVSARDVGMELSDRRGSLRISVTVPVAEAADQRRNLVERGEELRQGLIDGMRDLAGREVGAVDIRYAGVRRSAERRVR